MITIKIDVSFTIINKYLNLNLFKNVIKFNYLKKNFVVKQILIQVTFFHLKKNNAVVIIKIKNNSLKYNNKNYFYKIEKKISIF